MKQLFKLLPLCVAATVILACNKETNFQDQNSPVKTVKFSTAPYTKTVFGTQMGSSLPTLWTDNHDVAISLNLASSKRSTTPVVSASGSKASFTAEIEDDGTNDYNFYAVSPYEAVFSVSKSYQSVGITIPSAQTPTADSPDELAQILYSDYAAGSTFPASVTMTFSHLTAYGKIGEIKNLALEAGETIQSISMTAAENWAGRYYYYVDTDDIVENSASSTITITTSSTTDIWFGCAPVDLGGETVDVVITTDLGTFSKTITIPAGKKFESGKVGVFNIDMNGITRVSPVTYTLVTDVADLTLGSEVIIVANDADLAMSTTQNTNNRGQAAVTKTSNTISTPAADVQVFTIENGNIAGTYAFSTGTSYIYAVSGSNYLRTQATLDDTGSWAVSITNAGVATIKSVGTTDTRIIRHNSTSNLFSCYTGGQNDVAIYKKDGSGSGAITPKEPVSLTISGATTSYDVNDTYSFDGTVELLYTDTSTETLTASDYTVDDSAVDMTVAGTYTVTVSYNADPSINGSYDITVASYVPFSYTLTPVQNSSNNAYGDTYDVVIPATTGMTWNAPGNQDFDGFWRIGGKKISSQDRIIYAKSAMGGDVNTIVINTNGVNNGNASVNSITVTAHANAADAASGSNAVESFTTTGSLSFEVSTAKSLTYTKVGTTDCKGKYFRIVFTITNSKNANNGLNLTGIDFSE